MYQSIIRESLKECLENKASFLEHVRKIAAAGAIGYDVSLLSSNITYHLVDGKTQVEDIPRIAVSTTDTFFSQLRIQQALTDVREKKIDYLEFLQRIVAAGATGYKVDISEGKVTYHNSDGGQYIEPMPKLV
jgi:uncharacterized protein YbcV (DUF1398 family)